MSGALDRVAAALARAEEELPRLAAPDGTVAVRIEDLREVLNTHSSGWRDARGSYCDQCSCDLCAAQQKVKHLSEAIETAKLSESRCWSCSCGWVHCYTPADIAEYGEPSECGDCYRERLVEQDASAVAALAKSLPSSLSGAK